MMNLISRDVNIDELKLLAEIGGSDEEEVPTPYAATTVVCAVVATLTVSLMTYGMVTTLQDICP